MSFIIRRLDADAARAAEPDLAALLVDAVAHRASVNFMAGLSHEAACGFWRTVTPDVATGDRILLAAYSAADARLVGTVQLILARQPNQPFRAEVGKMIVHSSSRRQGLGATLLMAIEQAARAAGRTLLVLDTETGRDGDRLYRRGGWTPFGTVPGYAYDPSGALSAATFFYKQIAPTPPYPAEVRR